MSPRRSRILVISPAFHGLWRAITTALEHEGHEVGWHLYDDHSTLRDKLRAKGGELPGGLGERGRAAQRAHATRRAMGAVRAFRPDRVVIVKGDLLGDALWDLLDDRSLPRTLWLYDALSLMSYDEQRLSRADEILSFSASDTASLRAAGLPAHLVHLAFDDLLPLPPSPPRDEIVFAGARYPERERLFLDLIDHGVPLRAFGRSWSHHPVDRLRTWDPRRPPVPAGRDLDRAEACARLRGAVAAVNMHGAQDGFNLRVFEACGVGGVQLVDRTDIDTLYEPGREVVVYRSVEELVELCRRARTDHAWAEGLREAGRRRTMADHTFAHRVRFLGSLWV